VARKDLESGIFRKEVRALMREVISDVSRGRLTFSGALEFLKSQTMMMGDVSSSEAVMSLVD
jgi:hypothetical protein